MEIPSREVWGASGPVLEDLRPLDRSATSVSAYGRAKALERLVECPQLERLWLSGVSARHVSLLAPMPRLRELVIHDFRVDSLDALPEFPILESLVVCGSAKLKSLEGLDRYCGLLQLILFACSNYRDLSPVGTLSHLDVLALYN